MSRSPGGRVGDVAWAAALLGLTAYEIYALANGRQQDLLSERVWRVAAKWPLASFAAGMLAGHLFWADSDTYSRYRNL